MPTPIVFISYSREDSAFVDQLTGQLPNVNLDLWLDIKKIKGGDEWAKVITKAINDSSIFIFILSPSSVNSQVAIAELHLALDLNKKIIPILYQPCNPPLRIITLHYIDFIKNYNTGLTDLLKTLAPFYEQTSSAKAPENAVSSDSPKPDVTPRPSAPIGELLPNQPHKPKNEKNKREIKWNRIISISIGLIVDAIFYQRSGNELIAFLILLVVAVIAATLLNFLNGKMAITTSGGVSASGGYAVFTAVLTMGLGLGLKVGIDQTVGTATVEASTEQKTNERLVPSLTIPYKRVNDSIELAPNGQAILEDTTDKSSKINALPTFQFNLPSKYDSTIFSPDGKRILSWRGNDLKKNTLQLWDANTGKPIEYSMQTKGSILDVEFSADGARILSRAKDYLETNTLQLWDANTGKPIGHPIQLKGNVSGAKLSPDGKRILSWATDFSEVTQVGTLQLWDATTGLLSRSMKSKGSISGAKFSPDGRYTLTWASDFSEATQTGTLQLWDTRRLLIISAHSKGWISSAEFSPDGKRILSHTSRDIYDDYEEKIVQLWDANSRKFIWQSSPIKGDSLVAEFSPDGRYIMSRHYLPHEEVIVQLLDANTGKPIGRPRQLKSPIVSPDKQHVLSLEGVSSLQLWNINTGKPIGHPVQLIGNISIVRFSSDGKYILAYGGNSVGDTKEGILQLWNANMSKPIGNPIRLKGSVLNAEFSPDGKSILTKSKEGKVELWKIAQ